MKEEMIKRIIEEVLLQMKDLTAVEAINWKESHNAAAVEYEEEYVPDVSEGELIDIYNVKKPENGDAFRKFKKCSPSRIGIGNAGPRYLTKSALRFEADAATAIDAVRKEMPPEFIEKMGIFEVKTRCSSKEEFIQFPEKGRLLDDEGVETIQKNCIKSPQVQIILSDGHSSSAIMANAKSILPVIIQRLKAEGISVGTPFFVRFGRVGAEDHIAEILDAEIIIDLIGERPALASSQSMSAYIAYRPTIGMVESNRTVVSNISRLGTPPVEAGAHIVDLVKIMLEKKISGTALAQIM